MNPNFDPNSYSTPGGCKRLAAKLEQLEADPSKLECTRIIRAIHMQLLSHTIKIEEKKRDDAKFADNERRLEGQIATLTSYCKTLATDRHDYKKREKVQAKELIETKEMAKEKGGQARMLYHYAADRLSEVVQLKRDIETLQKSVYSSSLLDVSNFPRQLGISRDPGITVLGKRKSSTVTSSAESLSTDTACLSAPDSSAPHKPIGSSSLEATLLVFTSGSGNTLCLQDFSTSNLTHSVLDAERTDKM